MGWNAVQPVSDHPCGAASSPIRVFILFTATTWCPIQAVIAGTFDYGLTGCAALAQENLFATQFHPEKSHTAGLTLLKNFLDWDGTCS